MHASRAPFAAREFVLWRPHYVYTLMPHFVLQRTARLIGYNAPREKSNDEARGGCIDGDSSGKVRAHWVEASVDQKHWLDERFPGAREWLEKKNRELWLLGVAERCRHYPALADRREYIQQQLTVKYESLLERHSAMVTDERSQTHLQMGCLVVATERILSPWIRNAQEVEGIIKAQMGSSVSPLLRFLLRYVLYLSMDPFRSSVRWLRSLRLDYGSSFSTDFSESEGRAELRIGDCFYHRLLVAEQAQHLLACCCCRQDAVWFENLQRHKIEFRHPGWLGAGDTSCCLSLARIRKR